MVAFVASQPDLGLKGRTSTELVLDDGQKIRLDSALTACVRAPGHVVVEAGVDRRAPLLGFDGRTLALQGHQARCGARVPASEGALRDLAWHGSTAERHSSFRSPNCARCVPIRQAHPDFRAHWWSAPRRSAARRASSTHSARTASTGRSGSSGARLPAASHPPHGDRRSSPTAARRRSRMDGRAATRSPLRRRLRPARGSAMSAGRNARIGSSVNRGRNNNVGRIVKPGYTRRSCLTSPSDRRGGCRRRHASRSVTPVANRATTRSPS